MPSRVSGKITQDVLERFGGKIGGSNVVTIIEMVNYILDRVMDEEIVLSQPPSGMKRVNNIYYDPEGAKYTMEREE